MFPQFFSFTNNIANAKVSVNRSLINEDAEILLETRKYDEHGNLPVVAEFETSSLEQQFTTTETASTNFLDAGKYNVKVYVKGDGNSTFSVRDASYQEIYTKELNFKVLDVSSLSFAMFFILRLNLL